MATELAEINPNKDVNIDILDPITIQFNDLSYTTKNENSKVKAILNAISGKVSSGRLGAIVGPSGSGKTTLLNVLSGFKLQGVTGSITVNGVQRNIDEFRRMSTYIPQDFAMMENLTVAETVQFSADLKLGSMVRKSKKRKIIMDILEVLNLENSLNTMVSDLSNGERKRLSIAVELVTNPPVMFLDEPTSGLDSVAAFQLMSYLKKLALGGRIIICVMHQPSSRILKLFDDILVMSEGQVLYCGSVEKMIGHFQKFGFTCPNYYNPSDYVIEVATKDRGTDLSELITKNKELMKASKNNSASKGDITGNSHLSFYEADSTDKKKKTFKDKLKVGARKVFWILLKRALKTAWRDFILVKIRIVMHAVIGALLGGVFYDVGNSADKVMSNSSYLFFCVIFIFFCNIFPALMSSQLDTAVLIREHLNGWYSIGGYYFAKILSDIPLLLICPTLFTAIAYYLTGQPLSWERFGMFWLMGLLIAFTGQTLGLIFGTSFKLKVAIFLIPSICLPILLFSGFFVRKSEFSEYVKPVADVSFMRYALEGMVQSIYGYNRTNVTCSDESCFFKSAQKYLSYMDMEGDLYFLDVLGMLGAIVVLNIAFYISLVIAVKRAT